MEANDLKQCKAKKYDIESKKERIATIRGILERITPVLSDTGGVSVSAKDDKTARYVSELIDLERELIELTAMRERELQSIEEWIDTLPGIQSAIMRMRYVDGMKWAQIAQRTGYSPTQCYELHKKALEKLTKTKSPE